MPLTAEQRLAYNVTRRERYRARVDARLCCRCGAGLTETDGLACVECQAVLDKASSRYHGSAKGAATTRKRIARVYHRRRRAKLCVGGCGRVTDRARCEECEATKKAVRTKSVDAKEAARAG